MATRKRVKKQTLAEFRAWLNGVEELQPEDWAPNATQWKTIRDKIDGIAEPKPVVVPAPVATAPQPANYHPLSPQAQAQAAHIPPPPPPAGGVPAGTMTAPTPEATAVMPTQAPVDLTKAPATNVDTSDGNYDSGFA